MQALRPSTFVVAIACGVISTLSPSSAMPAPITPSFADHGSSPCGYGAPDGGELVVAERPVDAHAVRRCRAEVVRVQPDCDGGVVDGGSPDGAAGVHAAGRDGVVAVDDAKVVPVERPEHGELVVDEVHARVEPVARLEDDDVEPALCQLLREHAARRAAADDAGVHRSLVAAHRSLQLVDAAHSRSAPTKPSWRLATAPREIHA